MIQERFIVPSALCVNGKRPLTINGFLLEVIRQKFTDPQGIEYEKLRQYVWRDSDETGIMIANHTEWNPTISGKRPAIILRRNAIKPRKLSINNQDGITKEGNNLHTKAYVGSHTIFIMAKEGAAVELLNAEVYPFLEHFGPRMRSIFDLLLFELVDVGGVGELKEASDRQVIPITLTYAWSETWEEVPWSPKLKNLQLSYLYPNLE